MENIEDTIKIIHETISDYVELFHTKEDVETAIAEDMSVMGYPYELTWRQTNIAQDEKPIYKLTVRIKIDGSFIFMEFYYWN